MAKGTINHTVLIGNLGNPPVTRYSAAGKPITTLSLATHQVYRDPKTNENMEATQWHKVVCFNKLAELVEGFSLGKGDKVCVVGYINTRKFKDQNTQQDKSITEIVANTLQILSSKNRPQEEENHEEAPTFGNDDIPF